MTKILNMGSINIDYVYSVPHFVTAGETLAATSRQIFPGGKGMNQSIALARAGANVTHAGAIGIDGEYLLPVLQEAGVNTDLISILDVPSGHTVIQVNEHGENCILLFPGANRHLDEAFVDRALSPFSTGDILMLQNEVSCVAYAIKAAAARGMKIAFNPSPFDAEISKYPLNLIDFWLLNEIEGQALVNDGGENTPNQILTALGEKYPKTTLVLTLGMDGVLCRHRGKTYSHSSYKVQVVDTTAAGDTFSGYFISSIAKGHGIVEALQLASKAAAISVSRQGAAVSIPSLEEVAGASI